MTTAQRDRLGMLFGCLFLCLGLATAKLIGLVELSWWFVAAAPLVAFMFETIIFIPAAIAGVARHHFRRS